MPDKKYHRAHRTGWLRAAVLGANDGIVSTASLLLGVASAHVSHASILVTGLASLVAGTAAMAGGEYVSVSSQADAEQADLELERQSLASDPESEESELAAIYVARGLADDLARTVAQQLMANNALGAHARDELELGELRRARPFQAAFTSAGSFAMGSSVPLLTAVMVSQAGFAAFVVADSLVLLTLLGGLAAHLGGAGIAKGAIRVLVWGAFALGLTAGVGSMFGPAG
jgi:vacuolar iron transporter family protein